MTVTGLVVVYVALVIYCLQNNLTLFNVRENKGQNQILPVVFLSEEFMIVYPVINVLLTLVVD